MPGHETTTNLLSNSMVVLAADERSRRQLAGEDRLIPRAVEELLRFDSPVQGLSRTLTRAVDLHGQHLDVDDVVLLLFGSANRDDEAFADAQRFDIHRVNDRQLALGHGVHFCLGASLARLEARVTLAALIDRFPDWEKDMSASKRLDSGPLRGFSSLHVSSGSSA